MKAAKWLIPILITIIGNIIFTSFAFAGSTSKLSNKFTLDTRSDSFPPIDGWQILTNRGNTYNEDFVIDNKGKVWCFYFRTAGAKQPVFLKVFNPNGYIFKSEQIVGYSSGYEASQYNSIRAAVNDSTGDVWVALAGNSGSYFMIFDSTGSVKRDSTMLSKTAFSPKVTPGRHGKMWFSWHTQVEGGPDSQGKIACYSANGDVFIEPTTIGGHTGIFNTDIAIDDSNRIWTVFEIKQSSDYFTKFTVFNSNLSLYIDGRTIGSNSLPVNPQRQIYSDRINKRMWILQKDISSSNQQLHLFALNGSNINTIENIGECAFLLNEMNLLEVLWFNDANQQNKKYESSLYYQQSGNFYSREMLFDSTYKFVRNGIAYRERYPTLKVYAVHSDTNLTKLKFETVTTDFPEISVKAIRFDTTKISQTYRKQRQVKVLNIGNAALQVQNIISHNPHFSVNETSFQVMPGDSRTIVAQFIPTNTDSLVDYLYFVSNDPKNDSLKVEVSGKGYFPTIPKLTVDSDSLIFDTILLGNAQTKFIYIFNDDLYEPLTLYSIKSSKSEFTTADSLGFTLTAKRGKFVPVIFKPVVAGVAEGFLTIQSNDTQKPNLKIRLRGTGMRVGTSKIAVHPDSLNFGSVALGHQKSLYLEIENKGDVTLQINNITSADTQFTANLTNFSLPPYSRYYVLITYHARIAGSVASSIVINSTDQVAPNYHVPVRATGRNSIPPIMTLSYEKLNFGILPVGTSKTMYFWISNTGEEPLYIRSITSNEKRYYVYQSNFTIYPGNSQSISVTFTPDIADTINGKLKVISNDTNNDTAYVSLTGIGRSLTPPKMVLDPTRLTFGSVATTQSLTKIFTVYNEGEQTLNVTKIELAQPNQSYSISPTSLSVPSRQYRTVYVTFSPKLVGEINATINLTSNDPPVQTISLSGTGRAPLPQQIAVASNSINFETVAITKTRSYYLWISNTGETKLTVQNMTNRDSSFAVNITNFMLNPGQSQYVLVTFSPRFSKEYRDTLAIQSDDPKNAIRKIILTGVGRQLLDQNILLSSASLNFGEIAINHERSLGLTINNTGEKELVVSNMTNRNSAFTINERNLTVSPQSNRTISIAFNPLSIKAYQDTVRISSNDPDSPVVQVFLSGSGRSVRAQKISVIPDSLFFGQVGIGLTVTQNIQIRNDGEVELKIDSMRVKDSHFSVRGNTNFILAPGFSNWISVDFHPDKVDTFKTSLTIFNNDPNSLQVRVPMLGYSRLLREPNITIYPNRLEFGDVAIGRSKIHNLYVGNNGEKELSVTNAFTNNSLFHVEPTVFTVRPDASQMLTMTFQPTAIDTFDAVLTVASNDPDSGMAFVPMTGMGRNLKEPHLSYYPEELNFGKVLVGDSLVKDLTFQNLGDVPLNIFQISTNDVHFKLQKDSVTIEGGSSYALRLTFFPSDTAEVRATLQLRSNDPNRYQLQISLRGSGRALQQQISVSPSNLEFKDVRINSSATQYLWISNFGEKPLTISNIISNNTRFAPRITNFTLEQNNSKQVGITFTPDSVKTISGKLTIISNDPVADSLIIPLKGTARALFDPKIVASVDSLYYGQVALNNTRTLTVTVSNVGEKNLNVSRIIATNSIFAVNKTSFQLVPGGGETLQISFTPKVTGTFKEKIKIVSNDPSRDTLLVKVTGIGRNALPQQITVSDTLLNFGTVPTDRTKSLTVLIYNLGEKNLEIFEVSSSDTQFIPQDNWFIVNPGQSRYLTVTFAPVRSGAFNAKLTLKNNDPNYPEKKITLRGTGVVYHGPKILTRIESLNFGNTLIGVTKRQSLWIVNSSKDSSLKITNLSLNNSNFSVANTKITIRPRDSVAVQINYTPTSVGYHTATLVISSNDLYQGQKTVWLYGYGITENLGQNYVANLGWKVNGFAPFGTIFSPNPHTDDVLSDGPDRAWFMKEISLSQYPSSAKINLCFDDQIYLYINGTLVLNQTSSQPLRWNVTNFDVKSYMKLGRNRIAILVWNKVDLHGAFDCELTVDGVTKIKRGDQNWMHPDATWWYYGANGKEYPTPASDTLHQRLWFYSEYGLSGIDTLMAKWIFEPTGSDTLYDLTPYGQRAILHNITWVKGVVGQAMQFTGQNSPYDSYVNLFTSLNSIPQTIELWLNCYAARQYAQTVISNKGAGQYGIGMFISPNMHLGIFYYSGEFITKFVLSPNTWYFVTTQYKSNKIFVTVNNTLVDSISYVQGNPTGSNVCYLGGNPLETGANTYFYGAIDELQIKNTDSTPTAMEQVATIAHAPLASAAKGQASQLQFDIFPSSFKIISGTFQYAWGGSNTFRTKNLAKPDSVFSSPLKITIPADSVVIRGLKYRISLQTNYGPVYYPSNTQPDANYSWLEVKTTRENSTVILPKKVHRMISVPYLLDESSIDSVLVDNLGKKDPNKWRLFEWKQADTNYVAYDSVAWQTSHGFTPGKAYWLITKEPKTFDAGAGSSPENVNFRINLSPGWNMIGNPFPYPVRWVDIEKTSTLISGLIYRSTTDSIGWLYNMPTLAPWEGYFIWNGDNATRSLIIPPKAATGTLLKTPNSLADDYLSDYPDISILISTDVRCGRYIDNHNLLGAAEYASDGYDRYDLKEVPAIGDYVSLWIDNRRWTEANGAYTVDIRKSGSAGYVWNLIVDYSLSEASDNLSVRFKPITNLPEGWAMYLLDQSEDVAINLKDQPSIAFKPVTGHVTRKAYRLVIGTQEFVGQNSDNIPLNPLAFELFQNYPNPFNAITTIAFNLPKRMQVTVKVYNILGQLVKTLVDEEARGGHHKIYWDGRNNQGQLVSTGVFIVRLETKTNVAVKKLVLIK